MFDRILQRQLGEFQLGNEFNAAEAEPLLDALIGCGDIELTASVLAAWNEKGVTEDELFSLTSLMRGRMQRVTSRHETYVDIVGTGGSSSKTFNVSTASAFVIAGSGLPVAKHGNRAATSSSGSFDVLAALGVNADVEPSVTECNLNENGLCFMFAPRFHSLSPNLAAARRLVGRPTVFNNLGPLCNPAETPHNVIGVWDKHLLESTARVLARLGAKRSWVVYGEGGLDEIALKGSTLVAEVENEEVSVFEISAADFDVFTLANEVPSQCPADESAALITGILNNQLADRDAERLVLINAAAAIYVSGNASELPEAYNIAKESLRSGAALAKLALMVAETK